MKRIVYILLFIATLLGFSACQDDDVINTYVPDVPNYAFEPSGTTTMRVTEIESGSALLTFNELDFVSHYIIEVSKSIGFSDNNTLSIVSTESTYRLFFDDHSTLFARVKAIAQNGMSYATSEVQKIEGKYAIYHAGDDFNLGTTTGWSVQHGELESDYHSLIVQPIGNEPISLSKTFSVNPDEATYFQIRFITKNTESTISVSLEVNNTFYPVVSDIKQIQRGYIRYNLDSLNLSQITDVTVHIQSEGHNRGFQLDYVKFISEKEHVAMSEMINSEMENQYNELSIDHNQLIISNDQEPTVVATPSTEVDFDPMKLPILEIVLSGYLPRDTFKLAITNSNDEVLYETETLYIQNENGKFSYNLVELGITEKDLYTISYELSSNRVLIQTMQLVGESDLSFDVVQGEWINGVSAFIDENNVIRLKESTIYNYGDIRKQVTVDLGTTPIVFFDVVSITGAWAVKVIPEGASSDIYVARDNNKAGKVAFDLSQILQSQDITTFTFEIFVIGGFAADQTAALVMNPITFGDALNIVSNTSDEVISKVTYDIGVINLDDFGYIYIDIEHVATNSMWKLYIVNLDNDRRYEMKTMLERKYPHRYYRSKEGRYVYDIKTITELSGEHNIGIMIEVIGNGGSLTINDIVFTSNKNIPSKNNSAY